jgi:hypothetical protein
MSKQLLDRFKSKTRLPQGDNVIVIPAASPARGKKIKFAMVSLDWTADIAKTLNAPEIMLVSLLNYLSWKAKKNGEKSFVLSNEILRRYGVSRKTKYRVLTCLERTKKIQIQRENKQSPRVTLLT